MIAVPMQVSVSNVNIPAGLYSDEVSLSAGINAEYHFMNGDYERLTNLPQINGREIIGDKSIGYYLQDGLIIDGGNADGFN